MDFCVCERWTKLRAQAEKASAIERLEAEKAGAVASLKLKLQEAEEYSQHLEAEHSDGQVRPNSENLY